MFDLVREGVEEGGEGEGEVRGNGGVIGGGRGGEESQGDIDAEGLFLFTLVGVYADEGGEGD